MTEDIRNPINRAFIEQNCMEIGVLPEGRRRRRQPPMEEEQQPAAAAATDPEVSSRVEEKLERVMRQLASIHAGQALIYSTLRDHQAGLPVNWLTDEQFTQHVQWPEVQPAPPSSQQPEQQPPSSPVQPAPQSSHPSVHTQHEPILEPIQEQTPSQHTSPIAATPETAIPPSDVGASATPRLTGPTGTEPLDTDDEGGDCMDTAATPAQLPASTSQGEVDPSLQSMLDYDIDMCDVLGSDFDLGGGGL